MLLERFRPFLPEVRGEYQERWQGMNRNESLGKTGSEIAKEGAWGKNITGKTVGAYEEAAEY